MSTTPTNTANSEEINLGEVYKILKRYKLSIISIALISTMMATIFAYFATNIYSSSTTILIHSEGSNSNDFMSMALGVNSNNIDNEISILSSRSLAEEALNQLNIGTRYYTSKRLKTRELYKSSPFIVDTEVLDQRALGALFHLTPIDNNTFHLALAPTLKEKVILKIRSYIAPVPREEQPITYSGDFKYNEKIISPWFSLTVQKLHTLENESYSFTIYPNEYMAGFIQASLSTSQTSEFSTIVALSFQDTVPQRAVDILDAISATYLKHELSLKTESANKTLAFLDKQLTSIDKELQSSAQNLQKYKSTNVIINVEAKAQMTASTLADMQSNLYQQNMKENLLENILTYIQENNDINGLNLGSAREASPSMMLILNKIQEAQSLRSTMLEDYTEQHPDVLKITNSLISLKQTLTSSIKSNLRNIRDRKASLNAEIKKQTKSLESLPQQERELTQLTRNFVFNEKIYSYLLEKRAETAIIQSSTVSETRVVDGALKPFFPIKPKRKLIIIVGLILGLIIGVSLAFFRNFLDDTIKSIDDIESATDIPIYGVVPLLNAKKDNRNILEESLRVIRTNLEFLPTEKNSKLITVTSSVPTEGKTTTITELGKIIAKSHKKVIVVDLDMRRSRVQERYDLDNTHGMSTLLTRKHTLNEVIQKTMQENLDVITSGPTPPNPSELIMSSRTATIIEKLMEHYDYVLLDTPPIGLVTDAMMLLKMSDLNLFITRANFSKKDFIKNINRFVSTHDLGTSGIILNGVAVDKNSGYGYGYGYGYGTENDYYD